MKSSTNILFVGDLKNNRGPAVVNKYLYEVLGSDVFFLNERTKFRNYIAFLGKFYKCEVIVCSGISLLGLLSSIFSLLVNKKIVYLMHGAIELEKEYKNYDRLSIIIEKILLKKARKIICVSHMYKERLSKNYYYQKYTSKVVVIPNGFSFKSAPIENVNNINSPELDRISECLTKIKKRKILSVGGGRKEKNIINICRAIALSKENTYELIVVGADGPDTEEIKSYSFVNYIGEVTQQQLFKIYSFVDLYVQFSKLESFGMAPVEAVLHDCDLLLSNDVGISEYVSSEYVFDADDIVGLSMALNTKNNDLVKQQLLSNLKSWEDCASEQYIEWRKVC
ncbi:glycosyltransferase family 4 protein [Vibrio ulleungensis]|uniref:Glycosyltransferase family 4 protein n=1 Tax=Vibrio ulleungensis TaxID=2807619 RepID=A0ABS2HNJ5_9VIBR|nr:glycosyltransferase family 4 protein [Vibrio ulleungensis]MBM7037697.1 glycosyltransferase family 4 protein [Vibrio ulleungensis]